MAYSYGDVPSQAGKTVLITGANVGLGLSLAKDFLGHNPKVPQGGLPAEKQPACLIIASRSRDKTMSAVEAHLNNDPRVKFLELDLADLSSVREAAKALVSGSSDPRFQAHFAKPVERIDTLVLNAGILCTQHGKETTKDGFEMTIGVCHVGHFLFTKCVWPLLLKAEAPRVVPVSSVGHTWTSKGLDPEDLNWERRKYDGFEAYFQAKLANVYFCRELAVRCSNFGSTAVDAEKPASKVTSVTLTPGYGKSGLYRDVSCMVRVLTPCISADCDGLSLNTLRAACDPDLPSGTSYLTPKRMNFYGPPTIGQVSKLAENGATGKALWEKTEELVGEKFQV